MPNWTPGDWQPITTAPMDGTLVIITDGQIMEFARNYGNDCGWWSMDKVDFNYGQWDKELTHWMPAPPLPEDSEPTQLGGVASPEIDADIRAGRVKTFTNIDDLIKDLKKPW